MNKSAVKRQKKGLKTMTVIEKLITQHTLSKTEYIELLNKWQEPDVQKKLTEEAAALRQKYYGNKVFVRGLIEFTNYCKNNCLYCGIRRDNHQVERYRLSMEEILECCEQGAELGYQTFVLQGGEDPYFADKRMVEIIKAIKANYPNHALTLSIGEKSYNTYKKFKDAGADRYLLRHETANEAHYQKLHPREMSLRNRMRCLYDLKSLGFQTGAGFMVGAPGQTMETLADDLIFLQELKPEMVGIGPFIPHHETPFAHESSGSVELTLFLLSVIRIMLPSVLLPATTALGTAAGDGRERGMLAGANVVMPNLSPVKNRKMYELYDNKICTGDESAQCRMCLERRMSGVGFEIVSDRGDFINLH